jgi:phosphoribosyl-ATP pyrophosphohydrolase/phosphoribosyl-AMP cyclohydrolase
MSFNIESVVFDHSGLAPVVVQDVNSKEVLMLGYVTRETLLETIKTKQMVFYSRSRQQRWLKGETSGNYLHIEDLSLDCDSDALLALVHPVGPTCHTGAVSCFGVGNG